MPEQKQRSGLSGTYDHCDTNALLYQLSKFTTENLFILFADCIRRLMHTEGLYWGRHIKVSSGTGSYGDRRRVIHDGQPWCASPGNSFGEWVQVDLGKTCVCSYQGQHRIMDLRRPDFPRTVMGPVQNYSWTNLGFLSNYLATIVEIAWSVIVI